MDAGVPGRARAAKRQNYKYPDPAEGQHEVVSFYFTISQREQLDRYCRLYHVTKRGYVVARFVNNLEKEILRARMTTGGAATSTASSGSRANLDRRASRSSGGGTRHGMKWKGDRSWQASISFNPGDRVRVRGAAYLQKNHQRPSQRLMRRGPCERPRATRDP